MNFTFRKTINNKELFILVNLRSHGWHKYNSTGSIIMVNYGDEILIQDHLKNIIHNWLPKGKSKHRDKKISIEEITNYINNAKGISQIFYKLTGVENLKNISYQPFAKNVEINKNEFKITFFSNGGKKINLIGNLENNNLHIYYTSEDNIQEILEVELK